MPPHPYRIMEIDSPNFPSPSTGILVSTKNQLFLHLKYNGIIIKEIDVPNFLSAFQN
jgi:hypothetical protein